MTESYLRLTSSKSSNRVSTSEWAYEWAFMLLLGADENDLTGTLDIDQKDTGLRILEELCKNPDITKEVTAFRRLCGELENSLDRLKTELEKLMKTIRFLGNAAPSSSAI